MVSKTISSHQICPSLWSLRKKLELRPFSRKTIPKDHPLLEDKALFALEEPPVSHFTSNFFFSNPKMGTTPLVVNKPKQIIKIDIKENVGLSKIYKNFFLLTSIFKLGSLFLSGFA